MFPAASVPFEAVDWGKTKVLIGRNVSDSARYNDRVTVKITVNEAGEGGAHKMHTHPDQDEVLLILEGFGENQSADGTVQKFGPGDIVYIPAGTPHEDRSSGGEVTFLVIKIPPD